MKHKLAPICLILTLLLSACGTAPTSTSDTSSQNQTELFKLQEQLDAANEQIAAMRDTNVQLQGQLNETERELEKAESRIDDLNRSLEAIYKSGNQAAIPGQFGMTASLDELDMKQAISAPDPNSDIEEIRVYDLPAYSAAYTTIGANMYIEVLAKVIAVPTWGEDMGCPSSWYLVRTTGLTGIGNVVWIPEGNLIPYTYDNMYSVTSPLHLRDGAVYYLDKSMTQPIDKPSDYISSIEFFIVEHLENGTTEVIGSGASVWVYTVDLVYPEPLE